MPFLIRVICVLLVLLSCLCLPVHAQGLSLSAQSAILIEADSTRVLYQKQADRRLPMASTTKIMTAFVAIREADLGQTVTIPPEAVGIEGSSIYLYAGETLTLEALLYALMLASANDAATAIAIAVAGSVPAFVAMMNETADELGLTNTHFENPHGLDGAEHYTTARDLAVLTAHALENETFARLVSTKRHTIPLNDTEGSRLLINHNKMLTRYEGAIGVKTGFTKKSGRCLVSAAEREGVRLIVVTLNAPGDWNDHAALLDYGFSVCESVTLADVGSFYIPLPVVGGCASYAMVSNTCAIRVTLPKPRPPISCRVEMDRFAYAPLAAGQRVGTLRYYCDGEPVGESPLVVQSPVEALPRRPRLWERLLHFFGFGK